MEEIKKKPTCLEVGRERPTRAITHSGVFHADDVFAFAFLQMINPEIELERVQEVPKEYFEHKDWCIFDVGGGEFDHHHEMKYRDTKDGDVDLTSPYAAFGLVVAAYWPHVIHGRFAYRRFDGALVRLIDKQDAMGELAPGIPNTLSAAIFAFNPNWNEDHEEEDYTEAFLLAAKFAKVIIGNTLAKVEAQIEADRLVKKACEKTLDDTYRCVFMDTYMPYGSYLAIRGARWVCYPSLRGGYQIYAVSRGGVNVQSMKPDYIEEVRKREDTIFVHPVGFTAAFKTIDAAKRCLKELAIDYKENTPPAQFGSKNTTLQKA